MSKNLTKYIESANIAELLTKDQLIEISETVMFGFNEDKTSTAEWVRYAERALDLTQLKRQKKHTPMQNASNIKYPLITTAVSQFTARSVPELIKSGDVVNYRIIGRDESGRKARLGKRVKAHLNYQLLQLMPNWLEERERMLTHLAVVGTVFIKTWYDPIVEMPRSEMIPFDELIVNDGIKSLEEAERISHVLCYSMNEIVERNRFGLYLELDDTYSIKNSRDSVQAQELVEQHCFLDLDDDGYKEPYIVTVHVDSGKVLRIVTRYEEKDIKRDAKGKVMKIKPEHYFSDYHFLPNPTGKFHSMGFGTYLLDMQETVNSVLNQLLDAGKLANIQGGFIGGGLRLRSKTIEMEPGEWKVMEAVNGEGIKNNIVPLNYKEPSTVLYQLLGFIVQAANTFTSTTEALTGQADTANTSPNTIAMIQNQGLKVFVSIQRRVGRGYKKEISKIVKINQRFLNEEEYVRIVDPMEAEVPEMIDPNTGKITDYINTLIEIVPVTDMNVATEAEMILKSSMELEAGLPFVQMGVVDPRELAIKRFTALESTNIEKLVPPAKPPAADPAVLQAQMDMQIRAKELEHQAIEIKIKGMEVEAKIKKMATEGLKNIAQAEAAEAGTQLEHYKAMFESMLATANFKAEREQVSAENTPGESQPVDGQSINATDIPSAAAAATGLPPVPDTGDITEGA